MASNALVIGLLGLTFATTVFVAVNQGAPTEAVDNDRLTAIEERLETLERIATDTREEVRRSTRAASTRRAATPVVAAGTPIAGAGSDSRGDVVSSAALEQVVADRVQRTVEEQMERLAAEKRHRGSDGKWKPPMDVMVKTLDLSDTQRDALDRVFDGARDETFVLLRAQRPEGGSLLDDFASDLKNSEQPSQAYARLFGAITSKTVPGRNQTYLQAFEESEGRVRESIAGHLDPRQRELFDALNVDVFDVKTGYDPVGDYVKERLADGTE